ncbi:MAG: ABC transporter ATP-binding protein/permease [Ruminococcus sp.]|nr:ABC transporter ATP-binding protein/permease [Ruminococcus sp.]MCM1381775.1 ABC transporter ATP-binding protein/permease [Muribaculaceae bacterium]MCM1480684.1 ABC transporter ATP-binding protein/permease [Muribaculaceae bacterium]
MSNEKRTLKEKFADTRRMVETVNAADKGALTRELADNIPKFINNYAGIYLASLVIDGVTAAKPAAYLITAALIVCGVEVLTWLISRIIRIRKNCHDFTLKENLNKLLWTKTLTLDYSKTESIETKNKFQTAQENMENNEFYFQIKIISEIASNALSVVVGIVLAAPIIFLKPVVRGGFIGFVQSGWGFAALTAVAAAVISFSSFVIIPAALRDYHKLYTDRRIKELNRIGPNVFARCVYNYRTGKDVRIYREQELMLSKFDSIQNEFVKAWKKSLKTGNMYILTVNSLNALLTFLIYGFAIVRAASGMMSAGEVIAFAMYFGSIRESLEIFSNDLSNLIERSAYCREVFDYLDIPDEKYKGTIPTEKRDDNEYEFEFKHVWFKYPDTEEYVLKDINLKWRIGEKMALVGRNGSGKSTLIKLLCRLYDPTEGEITLNGIDIRKYSTKDYTDLFSVVFQDSALFAFSIGENVAADTEYDRALAEECVRKAGFSERLDQCPHGLDTCLYKDFDDGGVEISGGEAQKLCLARAVYKGAPFIVLDEPTAALDPISEYDIYTKFNSIVGTRTAVYISHRLSSCRFCDDITVLDKGKVAQRGNHDELVSSGGVYSEMWAAQAEYYKDTAGELFL